MVQFTVWGSQQSLRLEDWYVPHVSDGDAWRRALPEVDDFRATGRPMQVAAIADWLAGRDHPLPDFALGLQVQEVVEAILADD